MPKSARSTITETQRTQLQGLIALGHRYCDMIREVEAAALDITQELDTTGQRCVMGDASATSEIIYDLNASVDLLLRTLGIRVESSVVSIVPEENA